MGSDIALSQSLRQNLLSLQRTSGLLDQTTLRLNTGKAVNSALDDPLNFFSSERLLDRSGDLSRLLDGIGQSISAVEQANNGVTALEQLIEQTQSVVTQARDAVADGQVQAEVIGDSDISDIEDLIGRGNGFTADTMISFTLTDPDNPGATVFDGQDASNATLQAIGQINFGALGAGGADFASATVSTDELVTAINDINDQLRQAGQIGNQDVIEASLDSEGKLNIVSLNGGDMEINFFSDLNTPEDTASNILAAQDLGLGNVVRTLPDGTLTAGGTQQNDVLVTALGQPALSSTALFANDGSGQARVARASDALTGLSVSAATDFTPADILDTDQLFVGGGAAGQSFSDGDVIRISVNGNKSAAATVNLGDPAGPPTIQDLIDSINNTGGLSDQIEASFDTETGQIRIKAISPDVETVDIDITDVDAGGFNPLTSRLGFGARQAVTADATGAGATAVFEERLQLAAAATELAKLETDFDSLRKQIDDLVADSDFRGTNLLLGDTLLTIFNEDRTSFLETTGQILNSSGLGLIEADFSRIDTIEGFEERTRAALGQVRGFGSTLANDLGVIESRENFTKETITTLEVASDKLVLADQNEEGAKLLALQTRQQLGLTSLSLSSQAQQGILQLF